MESSDMNRRQVEQDIFRTNILVALVMLLAFSVGVGIAYLEISNKAPTPQQETIKQER
jgi:hypothetical protein